MRHVALCGLLLIALTSPGARGPEGGGPSRRATTGISAAPIAKLTILSRRSPHEAPSPLSDSPNESAYETEDDVDFETVLGPGLLTGLWVADRLVVSPALVWAPLSFPLLNLRPASLRC